MMKPLIIILILAVFAASAFGTSQLVICGNNPGEIYLVGPREGWPGFTGFYYSSNHGETLEMRIAPGYFGSGSLSPDPADSTLFRILGNNQYYSTNGGYSWNLTDSSSHTSEYASGTISGEIYRRREYHYIGLERSENYGVDYDSCLGFGFPDSLGYNAIALGSDSGEIYALSNSGYLYYSSDNAENFTFLSDIETIWGIPHNCDMVNGAESGEIYFFLDYGNNIIYRVSDYGNDADIIADFPPVYDFWYCDIAISRQPGELYFYAVFFNMLPGGTVHIYHTTNYFQDWDVYVHVMEPYWINPEDDSPIPSTISLRIYPNPTNAAFNISYDLNSVQNVSLVMYNMLGQQVWQNNIGTQSPGVHRLSVTNDQLPSGRYYLLLQSQQGQIRKTITIIK